jgi:hypothetical protein
MNLPEGDCGSYMYTYNGGSENGGLTFYQSNCSRAYMVFYRVSGILHQYASQTFEPPEAAGEDFCAHNPMVYSCYEPPDPPFDWCNIDPDCVGPHNDHRQLWE